MFHPTSQSSSESPQICRQFTLSEIQLATRNFDELLVIGRGGFGKVYKGTIYGANLFAVAIKRLDSTSNQGASEFWAEVKMLSRLRHCHLMSLIGYCNDEQEMILVYEYMPHGTLEDHLHKSRTSIPWVQGLKICIGAARGLDYLHTGTNITRGVIHRDMKCSNILLHDSWEAKISDFGLSKVCPTNQPSTHVSTFVKGTFGYLDPDYFASGKLTRKSDVYAFGVVLFEVLCRKRAVDTSIDEEEWGLARWAQDSIKEGRLKQIVDTDIREAISTKCLKDFSRLAVRCLHSHPKQRPTMAEIMASLESVLCLQEKANRTLYGGGMTIFGRRVPMFVLPSNGKNSVEHVIEHEVESSSSNSLKLFSDIVGDESRMPYEFDYDTICVATDNFSDANIIPQSTFASMYKGMLENGQRIGIAQPYVSSKYQRFEDLLSLLVRLQHENLLKLLGYYIKEATPFFVFELAANGNLDRLIYDPNGIVLGWNERYKIILGVARALLYLHHKNAPIRIIHGDVRPENILLDVSLEPKLSDFGFAGCLIDETECVDTDVVHWTLEHTARDHKLHGRLSTKSDVFSFGMLILKIISGCRTYNEIPAAKEKFLEYAWVNWWKGTSSVTVDPGIDADSVRRFIHIGLLCAQPNANDRPTMEEVNDMLLTSSFLTLPIPKSLCCKYCVVNPKSRN
ncbi:receptor-like protein kinase ANXUR2 [Bidens hawaiensis]|uniref:receptor-like protein kinase ANXUR2 n=1 Tax=Bidens hawaiensis TaxID=980011 RepID=UPI00404BA025